MDLGRRSSFIAMSLKCFLASTDIFCDSHGIFLLLQICVPTSPRPDRLGVGPHRAPGQDLVPESQDETEEGGGGGHGDGGIIVSSSSSSPDDRRWKEQPATIQDEEGHGKGRDRPGRRQHHWRRRRHLEQRRRLFHHLHALFILVIFVRLSAENDANDGSAQDEQSHKETHPGSQV